MSCNIPRAMNRHLLHIASVVAKRRLEEAERRSETERRNRYELALNNSQSLLNQLRAVGAKDVVEEFERQAGQ